MVASYFNSWLNQKLMPGFNYIDCLCEYNINIKYMSNCKVIFDLALSWTFIFPLKKT